MRDDLLDNRVSLSIEELPIQESKHVIVKTRDLYDNPLNEFKIRENSQDFIDLLESVKEVGFINPVIVKKLPNDDYSYMLISGHRRKRIAEILNIRDMDCYVVDPENEYDEIKYINECNFKQRNEILPSERAKALKREMDAQNRHGQRTDLMNKTEDGTFSHAWEKVNTADEVAANHEMQKTNMYRYIHLNELSDDLLDKVDDQTISFRCASEYLYKLNENNQEMVNKIMDDGKKLKQADFISVLREQQNMEKSGNAKKLSKEDIISIIDKEREVPVSKPTVFRIKLAEYKKYKFITDDMDQKTFETVLNMAFKTMQEKIDAGELIK